VTLYLAVTADRYELPVYVADSRKEMAEHFGTTVEKISMAVGNYNRRWGRQPDHQRKVDCPGKTLFVRVEVDE